jgi:hypothetical protein
MTTGDSSALAVFFVPGVEQENDRKARENPKITPSRTRLKTRKFFDDKRFIISIKYSRIIIVP